MINNMRRVAKAAFIIAIAGSPLAWACVAALGNLGIWVAPAGVPALFALLLYIATECAVVILVLDFAGTASGLKSIPINGKW